MLSLPRTTFSADADERYFGRSWQVQAEHRFARSAFRLASTRDVSNGGAFGVGGSATSGVGASRPRSM